MRKLGGSTLKFSRARLAPGGTDQPATACPSRRVLRQRTGSERNRAGANGAGQFASGTAHDVPGAATGGNPASQAECQECLQRHARFGQGTPRAYPSPHRARRTRREDRPSRATARPPRHPRQRLPLACEPASGGGGDGASPTDLMARWQRRGLRAFEADRNAAAGNERSPGPPDTSTRT